MVRSLRRVILSGVMSAAVAAGAAGLIGAEPDRDGGRVNGVTSPEEQFGHDIGDDYVLVNYTQYVEYLQQARSRVRPADGRRHRADRRRSDRVHRHHHLAGQPSPAAAAQGRTIGGWRSPRASPRRRRACSPATGKAVVWIDGGLHATEVLGAQQLIETIYQLTSRTDPETIRILNDVIVLLHARQPRRHGARLELVHARARIRKQRSTAGSAAALPEVHRARQQPRLLHDESGRRA